MAGPCVEDTASIDFTWDDPNLKADVKFSATCDNDLDVLADGLYYPAKVSRYFESDENVLQKPVKPGVTLTGFGANIDLDAFAYFGGPLATPYPVTESDTLTYKNASCHNQIIEWTFTMPQTTYRVRGGWDVQLGLSTGLSGCSLIPSFASLRLCSGIYTGYSKTDTSYNQTGVVPIGVTFPPTMWGGQGIIKPGETVTIVRRLYLQVDSRGNTNAFPQNEVWTLLEPSTVLRVRTWR